MSCHSHEPRIFCAEQIRKWLKQRDEAHNQRQQVREVGNDPQSNETRPLNRSQNSPTLVTPADTPDTEQKYIGSMTEISELKKEIERARKDYKIRPSEETLRYIYKLQQELKAKLKEQKHNETKTSRT